MDMITDWYLLRLEEKALKARIKALEPEALDQAIDRVANEEKKTFDIGSAGHKVQVRFTKKKVKPTDHPDLEHLDELIQLQQEQAARDNADVIAQTEKDIDSLTKALKGFRNTDEGRRLQGEYDELAKQFQETVPVLALKGV